MQDLTDALTGSPLLVVNGAVGSGKTRLAGELAARVELSDSLQVTRVACAPGDLGVAVVARCERAMDRMPGSLSDVLHKEARLLIVDDVHHLPQVDVARLIRDFVDRPGRGRLMLLTRDILPLPRHESQRFGLRLEGLDEASARDLWLHLEELYGPTSFDACDQALGKTRGMPLAMRREYARSRYGDGAWELGELPAASRAALEAVSVARLPAAPAAVASLLADAEVEAALIDLVSRQLIDPLDTGRFAVHDVVRDQVLEAIDAESRARLEMRAVDLIRGTGRGVSPRRPAWTAGDDGAIALLDEVDRAREIVMHLIAADEPELAVQELVDCTRGALARGAGGELLAQIEHLRALGVESPRLARVAALVAVRHGRIADAIELGDDLDAPVRAYLRYRAGEVTVARDSLTLLCGVDDRNARAVAAAALSEIELACGCVDAAEDALANAFEDRAGLSSAARAELHLAFAEVESYKSSLSGARAALARAASAADDGELAARVDVQRVRSLVSEQRFTEASKLRRQSQLAVAEVDCVPLRDELARCEALVECNVGSTSVATESLHRVATAARRRGDEIGALRTDLELAGILVAAGELTPAAEIAHAVSTTARSCGLLGLVACAELITVSIALQELRIDLAAEQMAEIDTGMLPHRERVAAESVKRELAAWRGDARDKEATSPLEPLEAAQLALASGDAATGLRAARRAATEAERLGQRASLGKALAIAARLELARGNREEATVAASRAARESLACGGTAPHIESLLVLSALARDNGDVREAATYARDARSLACDAGLPVQRLIAAQALEVISRDGEEAPQQLPNASAATASKWAVRAADAMLADLGLSAARPFRCVSAGGTESLVASASPDLLGMNDRSLVVDAVRQVIVRDGETVAELRRRSLLKRLLFLFSSSPERVFSKEEIVENVWEVEYHPLRHDAALFTNIMRIRRLLGADGIELIQVSEEGYALVPPRDFLYVEDTSA